MSAFPRKARTALSGGSSGALEQPLALCAPPGLESAQFLAVIESKVGMGTALAKASAGLGQPILVRNTLAQIAGLIVSQHRRLRN